LKSAVFFQAEFRGGVFRDGLFSSGFGRSRGSLLLDFSSRLLSSRLLSNSLRLLARVTRRLVGSGESVFTNYINIAAPVVLAIAFALGAF